MLEKILMKLAAFCEKRKRVLYITGTDPSDVYLIRYYLLNWKYFKLYLHIFLRSDRDDPHDHPWDFWTLMIRGQYREEVLHQFPRIDDCTLEVDGYRGYFEEFTRSPEEHRLAHRKAEHVHRVMLEKSYTLAEKDQAPMTLFWAGPHKREWGFVRNPNEAPEWFFWKKYLGLPENEKER